MFSVLGLRSASLVTFGVRPLIESLPATPLLLRGHALRHASHRASSKPPPPKAFPPGTADQAGSSALRFQQRSSTKTKKPRPSLAPPPDSDEPSRDAWSVVGYSTAHSYDLHALSGQLAEQGLYEVLPLTEDLLPTCVYARATYKQHEREEAKDVFFFEHGSVVFWNFPELERQHVLQSLRPVETAPHSPDTVEDESERMTYRLLPPEAEARTKTTSSTPPTPPASSSRLAQGGEFRLQPASRALQQEKYAFSNGVSASVKLGALEADLDRLIDSIEFINRDLKSGRQLRLTRPEVLQKTGEVFELKHMLNLSSDLLDTPDFYWDREHLQPLYEQTCKYFYLMKRTRVMNEKLAHCSELMDLVTNHLNDVYHCRLEWYIIVLIMIEVCFEMLHFVERYL